MREGRSWVERALALDLLDEVWPALLLGLTVGIGVLVWMLGDPDRPELGVLEAGSTWPLVCLVPVAAWVGLTATGGSAARLGFMFARPLTRQRWLAARLLAGSVAVGVVGVVVHGAATMGGFLDLGPPLPLVVGAVLGAMTVGALAGACATTETKAVGVTVIGVVFLAGPAVALLDGYGVTWRAVGRAVYGWGWMLALLLAVIPVVSLGRVVAELPRRCPRRIAQSLALTGVGYGAAAVFVWPLIMDASTNPVHNRVVGIEGRGDGLSVRYTMTKDDVDGILVERADGSVVRLWEGGVRGGRIVEGWPSDDGRLLAVSVVPPEGAGRYLVLFDLETGEHVRSPRYSYGLRLEYWVAGRRAVVLSKQRNNKIGLVTLDLEDGSAEPVPVPPKSVLESEALVRNRVVARPSRDETLGGVHLGVTFRELDSGRESTVPIGLFALESSFSAWLDDEHFAVVVTARVETDDGDGEVGRRTDSWVFVIHRGGVVVVDLRVKAAVIRRLEGPATGPWRVTKDGTLAWLDPTGCVARSIEPWNLGSRQRVWMPHLVTSQGVLAVDQHGRRVRLAPWSSGRCG